MTKKETLALIKELCGNNADVIAYCDHEIELLSKKSTKANAANDEIKETVMNILANATEPMAISEIISSDASLEGLFPQKIASILTQLKRDNLVERTEIKRIAHYKAL